MLDTLLLKNNQSVLIGKMVCPEPMFNLFKFLYQEMALKKSHLGVIGNSRRKLSFQSTNPGHSYEPVLADDYLD